jgi:FdhD protein
MDIRRVVFTAPEVSPEAQGELLTDGGSRAMVWRLAEETPVAILVNGESFAVMMITPADLEDFAVGFALTEGLVRTADAIDSIGIGEAADGLVVNLRLANIEAAQLETRRRTLAGRTGCGICGAQTIAAALPLPRQVYGALPSLSALSVAYAALGPAQAMNRSNHTTHAAAFCSLEGSLLLVREDIGRHNALDKLAGALLRDKRNAAAGFILLSSRVSVEMVQKAAAMGAPSVAAVSAPSALALRIARTAGMVIFAMTSDGVMMFRPDEAIGREGG